MIELRFASPDWVLLRQAMALSLYSRRPVRLRDGNAFLAANPRYLPLMGDMRAAWEALAAGRLAEEGDDLLCEPAAPRYGNHRLRTAPFSSAVEILLALLPALSLLDFRTSLVIGGVTHSPLSHPTDFLRDTLFGFLERMGYYASIAVKRFGFYGTGGGAVEARVYPAEAPQAPGSLDECGPDPAVPALPEGGRVYISRMSTDIAQRQKDLLSERLPLAAEKIVLMEVIDADGRGNFAEVSVRCGGVPLLFSRTVRLYDSGGEFIFREEEAEHAMNGLVGEIKDYMVRKRLPLFLAREVYPYTVMSGLEGKRFEILPGMEDTVALVRALL